MLLIKSTQAVFFFFICLIITGVILNCSRGLWLWAYCHGIYPFMVVEYCNDGLTHSFQRTSYCSRRIPSVLFCDVSHQYSFYQPRMVSLSYWDSKIGGDTDYHISLCVVFLRGDSIYASPHKHYRLHSYTQHHPDWPWDTCEWHH